VGITGYGFIDRTVYVQATERADNAIALAEEQTREELKNGPRTNVPASFDVERKENIPGSRRKIIIQHKDGTRSVADIEKFMATKETRYNPLIRDGDVVVVPAKNIMRDFIGVYGAVNGEGTYEYVEGDSLMSMIRIARGCSPLADSGLVEVLRMDQYGNSLLTIHADMRLVVEGKTPDISLQRGDRVVVKERVELRRDYKVRVNGEVLYPGFYPVTKDSTKLSEVIAAAGGFTDFASPGTSKIFRRSVTEKEISSERLESARGGVTPEDSAYFYLETNVRLNREQVVSDFVSLFSGDKSKDVYLRDGDDIVVASKNKTIYVFGQVIAPGHVPFVPGQNFKFYVQKAGGFTQYAREGDVRIIKANTKQWLDPGETSIEGGDYVWVPKEPYRPFGYYIQVYSQVFGILGTIATLVVLVIQVRK
jgi:protein involved in polysaccharide export with SLBB domain